MPRFIIILMFSIGCTSAKAQWNNTKHHFVVGALAGARVSLGNMENLSCYQLSGRAMYYYKRRMAAGGELGFMGVSSRTNNYNSMALNGFLHMKFVLGFYGEGGLGAVAVVSDGRNGQYSNAGLFLAAGFAKKFGPKLAFDMQLRTAPSLEPANQRNLSAGIRLGMAVKI